MGLRAPEPPSREGRLYQTIEELKNRVRILETNAGFQQISGTPTSTARDGVGVVDSEKTRLWMRVNGTWRYVTLT